MQHNRTQSDGTDDVMPAASKPSLANSGVSWEDAWRTSFPNGATLSVIVPVYNERYLVTELLTQLLNVSCPGISRLEIIIVDDGSTDGTAAVVQEFAAQHREQMQVIAKTKNEGKGAAIRAGIDATTGDLIVIQDADLEYDPQDLSAMVRPFLEDGADVVYGSRFAVSSRRRALYFRHTLGNHILTFLSNLITELNLTDVETCYKMFRAPLLKSIPIRSDDFAFEIEITAKISKRHCRIYEVPISYRGRAYSEGKKIRWWDGLVALSTMVRFWFIDDLYRADSVGVYLLHRLERTRRFSGWLADAIRPWLGDRVLEIEAGLGDIMHQLIPRDRYVASDVNKNNLNYLRNLAAAKARLEIQSVDLEVPSSFDAHEGAFDTVLCLNVLEQVDDPMVALHNLARAVRPGGRVVLYVPQGQFLYSRIDEDLGHRCRYDRQMLTQELQSSGFLVEHLQDFNRTGMLVWWWNGRVLRRRDFSRWQLKIFDLFIPLFKVFDRFFPWPGLGLIAVARKTENAA